MRVNWIRLQVFFSLPTSSLNQNAGISDLINLLSEIVQRTKFAFFLSCSFLQPPHFCLFLSIILFSSVPIHWNNAYCNDHRYVDQLEKLLQEKASLSALYYEKAAFMNALSSSMKFVTQSRFCSGYLSVGHSFMENVSPYYPKEGKVLGPKACALIEQIYSDLAKRISELLHEVALTHREFALKVSSPIIHLWRTTC